VSVKKRSTTSNESRSGSLNRNNVYSADAVRDWAWRVRSGIGFLKMNEKFMLVAMSTSVNPLGLCEMPVRYLADHIGVGLRQAQRIIGQLIHYELVRPLDVAPEGRPVDVMRKFSLNLNIDPDTWRPTSDASGKRHYVQDAGLVRGIKHAEFMAALVKALPGHDDYLNSDYLNYLSLISPIGVRSRQFDFVSPSPDVTTKVFEYKKIIIEIASRIASTPVERIHMIPRKGYR